MTSNPFTVSGTIYDAYEVPMFGVTVQAYDQDLRSTQLLGQGLTDVHGFYSISYTAATYSSAEYLSADLFITVLGFDGLALGRSDLFFNVPAHFILNFKMGNTPIKGPAEFDLLVQKVKPLADAQKVALAELQENDQFKDISFLAGETGEDRAHIALLPLAYSMASETKLAADIFYGLFRLQFPTVLNALLLVKSESISKGIKTAVRQNIISARWEPQIGSIINSLNSLAVGLVLSAADDQTSAFKQILATALPDAGLQQTFVFTYLASESTPETFWTTLARQKGFTDPKVLNAVQHVFQLNLLTNGQPALISLLYNEQQKDPGSLPISQYASFTVNDWSSRIWKLVSSGALVNFPAGIEGITPEEKTASYAAAITSLVKMVYPVSVFASRLVRDSNSGFEKIKNDLLTFFSNNAEYDLKTNTLNSMYKDADLQGIVDTDGLKKELASINLLYKLTNEYTYTNALRIDGIRSATELINKYTPAAFSERFASVMPAETAASLYRKAQRVDNRSTVLTLGLKMRNDIPVYAINGAGNDASPDYESMFGDTNCDCEECQSVYAPSAYFVDVLNTLRQYSPQAYTLLTGRRSDLIQILLTCKNTNTPLPYIDLVNELLESILVPLGPVVVNGVDTYPQYQTTNSADELLAYPEHVNASAYTLLKTAATAFNLPLDLPLEETRVYLGQLDIHRYQLMELFFGNKPGSNYTDLPIAVEYLRLSWGELAFINGTTSIPVALSTVAAFLADTGLTYMEMLQLLECYFVNPLQLNGKRSIEIVSVTEDATSCTISDLKLQSTDPESLKINPFIRIWKKTGWNVLDLDRVFTALGITEFTGDINTLLIIPLSHIARLTSLYRISIQNCLAIWANLDTAVYYDHSLEGQPAIVSQYAALFLNKQIVSPVDADFSNPGTLSGTLAAKSNSIRAALNLSQKDFEVLIASPFTDGQLTLANLSILFRYSMLARTLNLAISDLMSVIGLTGIDPFKGILHTDGVLSMVEKLTFIRSSGFTLAGLESMLLSYAYISPLPDNTASAKVFSTLNEGLKKIELLVPVGSTPDEQAANKLRSQTDFITDTLATAFSTESSMINVLVNTLVKSTADSTKPAITPFVDPAFIASKGPFYTIDASGTITWAFPDLYTTYISLSDTWLRIAALLFRLRISTHEFLYFQANATALTISHLWNLPAPADNLFPEFESLCRLLLFRNRLPKPDALWFNLFDPVISTAPGGKQLFSTRLASLTAFSPATIEFLIGPATDINDKGALQLVFPADYINGRFLVNILDFSTMAAGLGISVKSIATLAIAQPSDLQENEAAALAQALLKSAYDDPTWLAIIGNLSNQLRTLRRDALLSYILTTSEAVIAGMRQANHITDANSLYAYLLIDVDMDACMQTSRIKQAISSVQLFVDRCLLNLEQGVALSADFTRQWNTWRKKYRVWEANREIFLYPENWIDPSLRSDKSSFFKDLEAALNQNDVTDHTVADALFTYLQDLDTVADLEIIGFFPDALTGRMHVIGRTRNLPQDYYYTRQQNTIWSAWEKVNLDIDGNQVMVVVWNNRLMLFWGVFTQKQEDKSGGFVVPNAGDIMPPPLTYLEMTLCWSEYKEGVWTSKNQSKDIFSTEQIQQGDFLPQLTDFSLSASIKSGALDIRLYVPSRTDQTDPPLLRIGGYLFDGCKNAPTIYQTYDLWSAGVFKLMDTDLNEVFMAESTRRDSFSVYSTGIYLPVALSSHNQETTLFNNTPGTFSILPDHYQVEVVKPAKFFYSNGSDNFYSYSISRVLPAFPVTGISVSAGLALDRASYMPFIGIEQQNIQIHSTANLPGRLPGADYFQSVFFKRYVFQPFYHPYVCELIKTLNSDGIDGLYKNLVPDSDGIVKDGIQNRIARDVFIAGGNYDPTAAVAWPYPVEEIDFTTTLHSVYNWELFFHIPLLIATRLSENQQFEDARKWFHYIFDPTRPATAAEPGVDRFWITKPFKKEIQNGIVSIEELINGSSADLDVQLTNWEQNPFDPDAVARLRHSAYMRATVMNYIDNLIAWGDQLFRQDTLETINEATLLYIMAANLLGARPQEVPARAMPKESSFADIMDITNSFNNAKVRVQAFFSLSDAEDTNSSIDTVMMPLFCIPKNEQLLAYWDLVGDRLFKIRHCQNIEGIFQQLPLFEPPIDPALLIGGVSAGMSLSSILEVTNESIPAYRFQVLLQKANELCNEVRMLGSELLAALEKNDAEQLALLHSDNELVMLDAIRTTRALAVDAAEADLGSLNNLREVTQARQTYYAGREFMNAAEAVYFTSVPLAMVFQNMQIDAQGLAAVGYAVPQVTIGPFSSGATYGGDNLGNALTEAAAGFGQMANLFNTIGTLANVFGGFQRRQDDWTFQAQSAALELAQIDQQLTASGIRLAIAKKELQNHDLQAQQSGKVDLYLRSKFSNGELYSYMTGQLSAVYFQTYQLAYITAKKAQKCFENEMGLEDTSFIQYGYWDSLRKGLLSGDKLQYDLRRMETAYRDQNTREYELLKHVSLAVINPQALLQLRETGSCSINLPEELFDLDFAGHYFRRIKSVSMSIPCITGPYTSVNATLRLTANEYRISTDLPGSSYVKTPGDTRFRTVRIPATAIATSTAQNDGGIFELNFRDDRYLPFENAGAASNWTIELAAEEELRQFDYESISDILLHVKYTAREGNAVFKSAAINNLQLLINNIAASGLPQAIVYDIKREYAGAWYLFTNSSTAGNTLQLSIVKDRLPFFTKNKTVRSAELKLFAKKVPEQGAGPIPFNGNQALVKDSLNLYSAVLPVPAADITAENGLNVIITMAGADISTLDDLYLLLVYTLTA